MAVMREPEDAWRLQGQHALQARFQLCYSRRHDEMATDQR